MTNWRKILSWQFNDYSGLKEILDEKGYTYEDLGNELIINHKGNIYLESLTSLPDNIQFNNRGNVWLSKFRSLPNNKYEIFYNKGIVYYDWDGREYKEFNPHERNASLNKSIKERKDKIVYTGNFYAELKRGDKGEIEKIEEFGTENHGAKRVVIKMNNGRILKVPYWIFQSEFQIEK